MLNAPCLEPNRSYPNAERNAFDVKATKGGDIVIVDDVKSEVAIDKEKSLAEVIKTRNQLRAEVELLRTLSKEGIVLPSLKSMMRNLQKSFKTTGDKSSVGEI